MTIKNFLFGIVLFAIFGCEQYAVNNQKSLHAYFDLDSLLDAQIQELSAKEARIVKTVSKDGEKESRTFTPDTGLWEDEFSILRSFNINKPNNVGAYATIVDGESTIYAPNIELDLPIQKFKISYQNDQLSEINAGFSEFKYLYYTDRNITLNFKNGLLSDYTIDGTQNMILLDAVDYQISAIITIE